MIPIDDATSSTQSNVDELMRMMIEQNSACGQQVVCIVMQLITQQQVMTIQQKQPVFYQIETKSFIFFDSEYGVKNLALEWKTTAHSTRWLDGYTRTLYRSSTFSLKRCSEKLVVSVCISCIGELNT